MNFSCDRSPRLRLFGMFGWDPYGESMLAVLEKIGASNVLVGHSLFKALELKAPVSTSAQDPDVGEAGRYSRLEELACWEPSSLRASVHAAYRTPGTAPLNTSQALMATRSPFVRFCPDCAEGGIHLAMFQLSELLLCPIHERGLEDCCPACRHSLRHYSFTTDDLATIGCGACGWEKRLGELNGADDALRVVKRAVVGELVLWVETLCTLFGSDDAPIYELLAPGSVRPLTHYHALVPGPDWIERCMHAGSQTRTRVVSLQKSLASGFQSSRSPTSGAQAMPNRRIEVVMTERACRIERHLRRVFRLANVPDGAFLCTTGYRRRLVDDEASIAALALRWWRRFLTPFPLEHAPLEMSALIPLSPMSVPLWKLWEEIHTALRGFLRATTLPNEFLPLLVAQWTDLFLAALYRSLIGRAALFSFGQVDPRRILTAAEQTGSMPLLVLRTRSRLLQIVEVTNVAPESDFVALFRSGYRGFERERLVGAFWTDPVHELIALPDKMRRQSMEDLYQLTGRTGRDR